MLSRLVQFSRSSNIVQVRRFSAEAAAPAPIVHSVPVNRVPLKTRAAWFSMGLNCTLVLALYQLGQDASEAAGKLDAELKKICEETAVIQKGLRAKIAKLEAEVGKLKSNA